MDFTTFGGLMTGGLGVGSGSGIGSTDNVDPEQGGQGFAPRRRVF